MRLIRSGAAVRPAPGDDERLKIASRDAPLPADLRTDDLSRPEPVTQGQGGNTQRFRSLFNAVQFLRRHRLTPAGLGIAYSAKRVVGEPPDAAVNVPYLDAILYLLGISREQIEAADAEVGIVTPSPPV